MVCMGLTNRRFAGAPQRKRQYVPYGNYPGGYGVEVLGHMTEDWSNHLAERIARNGHLIDRQEQMVEDLANYGSHLVDHQSHIVGGDGMDDDPDMAHADEDMDDK